MGNLKALPFDYAIAIEKDIDVDRPRPLWNRSFAAEFALDSLRVRQKLHRHERSLRLDHQIQKKRLRDVIHRLRLVDRRYAPRVQSIDGSAQVSFTVTQVRTEAEIDRLHENSAG